MGRITRGARRSHAVGVLSWDTREGTLEEVMSERVMGQTPPGVGVEEGPSGRCRRDPPSPPQPMESDGGLSQALSCPGCATDPACCPGRGCLCGGPGLRVVLAVPAGLTAA